MLLPLLAPLGIAHYSVEIIVCFLTNLLLRADGSIFKILLISA